MWLEQHLHKCNIPLIVCTPTGFAHRFSLNHNLTAIKEMSNGVALAMGGYGPTLLTVSWVEFAICTVLIVARVYTALVVTQRVKLDLYLTLLTYVSLQIPSFLPTMGLFVLEQLRYSISCANQSDDCYLVDGNTQRGFSDFEHCVRAGPAYQDPIARTNRACNKMELGKSNSCHFYYRFWKAGNCGFPPTAPYDTNPGPNDILMDFGRK